MERGYRNAESIDSAILESSGLAFNGAFLITDIILASGSDASTVSLYDNVNSENNKKFKGSVIANHTHHAGLNSGILFKEGVYVVLTGTSPCVTLCGRMPIKGQSL